MKMSYFFKQTHISRKRIVLIFSDLLRQITLCLSSKDESATLKNSDTGAKFLTLFNMNWTLPPYSPTHPPKRQLFHPEMAILSLKKVDIWTTFR